MELDICEIYRSIQGETSRVGQPAVLVRLAGCNLGCRWCDTPEAQHGGQRRLEVDDVAAQAEALARSPWPGDVTHFLVTGGEPLLQPGVHELLARLLETGRDVVLETNGSCDLSPVDPRVARIVDLKPPGSGMQDHNRWENIELLGPGDEVKLVLADRQDYDWARTMIARHRLPERAPVLISPVYGELSPRLLAGWLVEDRLPVRMQVQLHRVVWGEACRGV